MGRLNSQLNTSYMADQQHLVNTISGSIIVRSVMMC